MKKRKPIAILLTLVMTISIISVTAFAKDEAEADDPYAACVAAGIFTDEEDLAKAEETMTKADLCLALDEMLVWDWDSMGENYYTDLTYMADGTTYLSDMDIYSAMLKALGEGVIYANHNALGTWDELTYADAIKIIAKALGVETSTEDTAFPNDADIPLATKRYVKPLEKYFDTTKDFDADAPFTFTDCAKFIESAADAGLEPIADVYKNGVVDWLNENCEVITVATVDTYCLSDRTEMLPNSYTYEGGWIETDEDGNIITEATGTKDLDIRLWVPEGTKAGDKVPVMLFTFGGSWIGGDNQSISPYMVRYMVGHGMAVASLTYRYEDEACFPYSMYDLQAQIRYLKLHADELGLDEDMMGVTGNSAGGYWAAELAVTGNEAELQDPGYVTFEGDQIGMLTELKFCGCQYGCFNMFNCCEYDDVRIRDYVSTQNQHNRAISNDPNVLGTYAADLKPMDIYDAYINGTDNLEGEDKELMDMMVQRFVDGSPIYNIDADDASFFFYHGTGDALCPINQAEEMFGALCLAGVENNVFRVCEGMGHGRYTHPQYYTQMMDWMLEMAGI